MMHVDTKNGRFLNTSFVRAVDQGGTLLKPRFIVVHYTGGSGRGAIGTLTAKDDNYVSAHTFTDTAGAVTQMVRFDRIAYHAGASAYRGARRLNSCSIGLELANPGYVRPGSPSPDSWPVTEPRAHASGGPFRQWYVYPAAQIESVAEQCAALMRAYGSIEEIVGHDDVCEPRGRKLDPGPAFDWARFRDRVNALL